MKLKRLASALLCFLFYSFCFSQQVIHLKNPSFEDMPRQGKAPKQWSDCGQMSESPPDIQPGAGFGVSRVAYDGFTYISMVVRDNNTTEAISQDLSQKLEGGKCYDFSLFLCQSDQFYSVSRRTEGPADYLTPTKIRIWGGNLFCDPVEFLGETALIDHEEWIEYIFRFSPQKSINHLIIEAYYEEPHLFPYNGHILMDNASPIVEVACDQIESIDVQDFSIKKIGSIPLKNRSFEKETMRATVPDFWQVCDDDNDLVTLEPANTPHQMPLPQHGINYMSLLVDDNTLTGALHKPLSPFLYANSCYLFSLKAARTDYMMRESPFIKKAKTNFDGLAKIKIWGSAKPCEKEDLLAETPLISHKDWKTYEFVLQPKKSYVYLRIEAAYKSPVQFFYNGHVLIDSLSNIQLFNCDSLQYHFEKIQNPAPPSSKKTNLNSPFPWEKDKEKSKDKAFKSLTYSVRDSDDSINENLLPLLAQAYPDEVLLFNIFAPTKEDGKFQEALLIKALEQLRYPKNWYKTKTYLED